MNKVLLAILTASLFTACSQKSLKPSGTDAYSGLGKESVSEADLQKYSPTKLPPQIETKIREMMDISTPGLGLLHPNKKQLFFTWKVTGVHQIWTVEQKRGFPIQITGGKDSTRLHDITPDGRWLAVSQDKDGQENPGLFLLSPDGLKNITVFSKPKMRARLSYISDDSKTLVYSANDEKPDVNTFYRYNITTGEREKMFAEEGQWFLADYTRDGRWLMAKSLSNSAIEYSEFDLKTRKIRPVLGQGEMEDFNASYARNEKDLLVVTSKFTDFRKLYLLKGTVWKELFSVPDSDVSDIQIDHKREKILISTIEHAYVKLHGLSAITYKPLQIPNFPNAEHVFLGGTTRDGGTTMLGLSSAQAPNTNYSFDWKTKKLTQWVYPSAPGINLKKFISAKLEYYPAKDGTKIPMFVRRPAECLNKLCPVIVNFHGGPEGQSIPGFSSWAQIFIDAGFILVEPNVRGSDGYGKKWLHSDDKAKRLDVIGDIEDCATYIKANWKVNGQTPKVGITGGSYGGYATLLAMTKYAGAYDAGVAAVGMSNLVTFLQNTAPYRRALRMAEYGDLEKDHDALVALSPVTYINQLKSPLMIIQGANDPRVPVGEALQIQKLLESKKIPSSLVVFGDEGHGAEKKDNQVLQIGHTLEFFEKYLK
ncbi:S9 family peptidase [Bdellovibrio svalbardensis]|uniref:Prolyl oligopeptidase family serine peptidase n=1 Tax=Bdellovibrio svalbardensis TaxID=2972972 RepID=A0ABT6DLT3_9BACT|nr:prolyl oligopeptidase family serine peptidase [Bdellovibrio svalbardensis]MDG0817025.1 prolyl oligopeptidase family serine peptidase [Bdellovibrio svalbardensis]